MDDALQVMRMGVKLTVIGDTRTLAWIRKRGQLYFDFGPCFPEEDSWRIYAGREHSPGGDYQCFNRGVPGAQCTYHMDVRRGIVVVDTPAGPWRDLWTLRVVRDLLRWMLFNRGAIFVHANLLAHDNHGVALVGKSRSGKTSLLMNMLRGRTCAFVAEDDLTLVHNRSGDILGLGWPGCLRIRRSMLHFFPELSDESGLQHPANDLERAGDPETAQLRIFPEEAAERFGCQLVAQATVQALVRLEWSATTSLTPLPDAETKAALLTAWDIIPERKAGTKPDYAGGAPHQWRACCFNPVLFDFFGGSFLGFTDRPVHEAAKGLSGFCLRHNGRSVELASAIRSSAMLKGLE